MKVIKEQAVLPQEVMKILEKSSKKSNLSYIEERTYAYLKKTQKLSEKDARGMLNKLVEEFNVKLPRNTLIKIVEMLPETKDELRVILYGITLEDSDIDKLLSIVSEYAKQ